MAFADYGPELLYRTGHSVLSIPNHRPQPGFAATYRVLTAPADADGASHSGGHRVDLILLCPSEVERSIFTPPAAAAATLYERLVDGAPPAWLRPLPLRGRAGRRRAPARRSPPAPASAARAAGDALFEPAMSTARP